MSRLLTTSALIAPFLIGTALAQDVPATPEPTDPPAVEQTETLPATDTAPDTDTAPGTDTAPDIDTAPDADTAPDDGTETTLETDPVPAPATDPGTEAPDVASPVDPATATVTGETIVQQQAANELRVDWITGTSVRSRQDENIGSIADLIIDQETNTITAAILSVGGFLGIGAKQIAVRFDELEIDFDAREIHLDLTREEADAAPEYSFRDRTDAPAPPAADGAAAPLPPVD